MMPDTEMMVSSNDQVKKVSLTVNPKYSLNIQNPASLTCDKITLPAPMASTTHAHQPNQDTVNIYQQLVTILISLSRTLEDRYEEIADFQRKHIN